MNEHEIQASLFKWLRMAHPKVERVSYAVPNAGKRSVRAGMYYKAEGLKPGVPDICIPVSSQGFNGLYIELKTDGGKITENQQEWLDRLSEQGYRAVLCHGFEVARAAIDDYLRG
jgi:hypothetical protein